MATTQTKVPVRPLGDRVLIQRLDEDEKTAGGLYIPDTAKEKPQKGKIVAVGAGRVNDEGKTFPLSVKAGDQVLFSKYAGTEIKIGNQEYLLVREDEVLGVFN